MLGNVKRERALLERTYDGQMTVIGNRKETIDGETVVTPDAVLFEGQPCALSRKNDAETAQADDAGRVSVLAKLFCAPELVIPAGCRITVTQYGQTRAFQYSGEAFQYPTHQELTVKMEATA